METMLAMMMTLAGVAGEDTIDTYERASLDSTVSIESEIEGLSEQNESERDHLEVLDRLQWLQENTIDLNSAKEDDLLLIPGITPHEAQAIVKLRGRVGKFSSVGQLAVVDNIGPEVVSKLQPYVHVKSQTEQNSVHESPVLQIRTRVLRDLQPRAGFTDGSYSGSSIKSYSRVAMNIQENVRSGVLVSKDAGEQFSTGFLSGFAEARLGESRVLAGDFTMEAGQGLVFWSGAAYGKGSDAVNAVRKSGAGLRPYRSSSEFGFFRGVSATTALDMSDMILHLTALVSRRKLSATLNEDGTFSAFYDAGLYRTESEITKRNTVRETILGGRAEVSGTGLWNAGINYYHSTFDRPLISSSPFAFSGRMNDVAGADASIRVGRLDVFGEIARSGSGGRAGILGGMVSVSRSTRFAVIYRDYGASFDHAHAGAFGERSNTNNEIGLYLGVQSVISRSVRLSGYVDHFKFRAPSSTVPLPATGSDMLIESDVQVSSSLSLIGRYAQKVVQSSESFIDEQGREARVVVD
ncbi:MAG: ComEA family DNA-binding protein [Bacteroidota bacterium]